MIRTSATRLNLVQKVTAYDGFCTKLGAGSGGSWGGRTLGGVRTRRSITASTRAIGVPLLVAAALLAAGGLLAGCGGDEERVALAIEEVRWTDDGRLELETECAELDGVPWVTTEGDAPPTVTIWGAPKVGTCATTVEIEVAPGVTKLVDAATSQVVDLPPRP